MSSRRITVSATSLAFQSHRWVEREPFGVVGAITPWNQPFQVNLAKVGPALAARAKPVIGGRRPPQMETGQRAARFLLLSWCRAAHCVLLAVI